MKSPLVWMMKHSQLQPFRRANEWVMTFHCMSEDILLSLASHSLVKAHRCIWHSWSGTIKLPRFIPFYSFVYYLWTFKHCCTFLVIPIPGCFSNGFFCTKAGMNLTRCSWIWRPGEIDIMCYIFFRRACRPAVCCITLWASEAGINLPKVILSSK